MKSVHCSTMAMPLLCKALGVVPSNMAQAITCIEDGMVIAGVVYDCYTGASVQAHIWIDAEHTPSKEWFAAIFDYPFNQLRVKKIMGQVKGRNEEALNLDARFGFVTEAIIEDYYEEGEALHILSMQKHQSKILNSPAWRKVVTKVGG